MPRSGLGGQVTATPAACSRSITPFQPEASAKAPCTSATVRGPRLSSCVVSIMVFPSLVVTTDDRTREEAPCAATRDIPRPATATAAAAPAPASLPTADRRDIRPPGMSADTIRLMLVPFL